MFNNIPPVTKNLLIINILMFLATYVLGLRGVDLDSLLALHYFEADAFYPFQFITYMFMHGNFMHLFFNMFMLWMFGRIIEQVFGPKRFLIYYIVCGLGAGLMQEIVQFIEFSNADIVTQALGQGGNVINGKFMLTPEGAVSLDQFRTVGASGAVYGILLAFGMVFPNESMYIIPFPFPIKAKYMVFGYALLELLLAMGSSGDGIAHMAHVGGMLFGLVLILHWRRKGNGRSGGNGFAQKVKDIFAKRKKPRMKVTNTDASKHADDMNYNAQQRAKSEEIDRILDKVKQHGYGSLSEEEKKKLFDASGK